MTRRRAREHYAGLIVSLDDPRLMFVDQERKDQVEAFLRIREVMSPLLRDVGWAFHVSPLDIQRNVYEKRAVHARWALTYVLRAAGLSLTQVAHLVNRDRSTVLYGLRAIERHPEVLEVADGLVREWATMRPAR